MTRAEKIWKVGRLVVVNILITLVAILVTLLILELSVRIFAPQATAILREDIWEPTNNGLGYQHVPNVNTRINTGDRDVLLITNERGYRVGSEDTTQQPDVRILALGDSFLEALQVDYYDTMTSIIEERLSIDLGLTVQIVNTGVSGYNPSHYRIIAQQELRREAYDLVIIFIYTPNDVVDTDTIYFPPRTSQNNRIRFPNEISKEEIYNALLYPINDWLNIHSHLYVLIRNNTRSIRTALGIASVELPSPIRTSFISSPAWETTRDIILDIQAEASNYKVSTMVVLIPGVFQLIDDPLAWCAAACTGLSATDIDVEQPSSRLSNLFANEEIVLLDTLEIFRQEKSAGTSDIYGIVDPHLGINGHRIVADYIYPYILEELTNEIP